MRLTPDPARTIRGAAADLRAGRVRCVDLVEHCLTAIDAREPEIRAWVRVDADGAREQARERDRELADGRDRGPLHGIPIGIKDIVDVQGLPTAAGFAPWADQVAEEDAPLVAGLREAGAVILGKTVTTTFAWIDPPVTRNPWNPGRTPGGSSSGSAAAVAAGMCLGAVGTQTGGSIVRPAAFCGVAGLKPTYGLVSAEGIVPFAPSLDHPGPIARTVGDLAVLLDAMAGIGPACEDAVDARTGPPTLGRLTGPFLDRARPEALAALDRALAVLEAAGARVVEVRLPEAFEEVLRYHRLVMAAEAAVSHAEWFEPHRDDYPERIRALVEEGLAVLAADYIRACDHLDAVRERTELLLGRDPFGAVDALAMPPAIGPAPDPSTTGDPAFNSPWSFAGLPTATFPVGLDPDGLPLGLQLIGPAEGDSALLGVAAWAEARTLPHLDPEGGPR